MLSAGNLMSGRSTYYTYVDSPIGPIFVAGDGEVVSQISFTTGHQVRHPQAGWVEDGKALRTARKQLEEYFAAERRSFDLQLGMHGTTFQKRAWEVLLTIPYGDTRTYGQIAEALGSPGAARAVGRANATNHLPLVVPCHRVIGADGTLTGFGGGLAAKQWLLRFEGALPATHQEAGQPELF